MMIILNYQPHISLRAVGSSENLGASSNMVGKICLPLGLNRVNCQIMGGGRARGPPAPTVLNLDATGGLPPILRDKERFLANRNKF